MAMYLLNSPVLGSHGLYRMSPLELVAARKLAPDAVSAVGHEGTAMLLQQLLRCPVEVCRARIVMQTGDQAIVFRLLERMPEGVVLDAEKLAALPYELALLECLADARGGTAGVSAGRQR